MQKVTKKHAGLRPATSVQNSERWIFWLNCKFCTYQKIFMKIVVLCHTARSILNRCEGVALLRKDLQVFIKRKALIWVDSRLCISWNGKVWWEFFLERTESFYLGKQKVWDKNAKISSFLYTDIFWINLKFFTGSHYFCVTLNHGFAANFSLKQQRFSIPTAPI